MAGEITSGNGGLPVTSFDIAAPDFVEQGKAQATGVVSTPFWEDLIKKYFIGHVTGPQAVVNLLVSSVDWIAAGVVALFGMFQGKSAPGFYGLLTEVLGDLLGTEISTSTVENALWRKGELGAFRAVGQGYLKSVLGELGSPATISPESGLSAAEGFMGYLLGFSIREGNLAFIDSFIPEGIRVFDGIKEYGQAMRASLGLGRMARQALHPFIQTLITDPLQWYVNRQYTPKLLGEGLAVRAFNKGWIDRATLEQELAFAGYSEQRIQTLIKDALTELSLNDAWLLYKRGTYTIDQLTAAYQTSAMDPNVSGDWLAARIAAEVEPYTNALISDWKTQLAGGYITLPQFQEFVSGLHMLPDARDALLTAVGQLYDLPRRKLTLAEVQSAFVEGLMDATDVSNFLQREGYSSDDAQILWFQTMLKLGTLEAKKAVAQYTYDKAKAKAAKAGEPEPPPPAILAG